MLGMRHNVQATCRALSVVMLTALMMLLAGCHPHNAAVGDTHSTQSSVTSSGVQRADVSIGLIGSSDVDTDRLLLDAYADSGLKASYVSTREVQHPVRTAQQGVKDMVGRAVNLIVIVGLDVTGDTQGWNDALYSARDGGIPVVLVAPSNAPSDERLYAATFTIDNDSADAVSLDTATMSIVNDSSHSRQIVVSTNS